MAIFWSGRGLLVGLAGIVGFLLTQGILWGVTQSDVLYKSYSWPKLLAGLVGALLAYGVARSGDDDDRLMFIPARFWPILFFALGVAGAFGLIGS